MDFARTYLRLQSLFEKYNARHAVIGGIGLGAYLPGRATADLDLAVESWFQPELIKNLEDFGYETLHRSTGFSNHLHTSEELGRLDLVYLGERTSELIFGTCKRQKLLEGVFGPVPRAEHMIAMKLQAIKNDPERTLQDLADIRQLIQSVALDSEEVRGYFERYDRLAWYRELTDGNRKS